MNIAFFSYEYPKETGSGGIGTYLQIITRLLIENGHKVTVFTGTNQRQPSWENSYVFRIPAKGWDEFNAVLPGYFIPVHNKEKFDIAECTDFKGCGLNVKNAVPDLPIVVRLHTPLYLVDLLLYTPLTMLQKARFILGSLAKGCWPKLPGKPSAGQYKNEFKLIEVAERICSPGYSIYSKMEALGFKLRDKTDFAVLPFILSPELRKIAPRKNIRDNPKIIFIGRLEKRKGVIDLARAIPHVLRSYPGARFTFVGESSLGPRPGVSMVSYLKSLLKDNLDSVQFTGKVPHADIIRYLQEGDIFVFPSHYESFGIACCEAMAAGKVVIGSENGGMAEIVQNGESGYVIKPQNSSLLERTIVNVIHNNEERLRLGKNARKRIETFLDPQKVVAAQVDCYSKTISMVKAEPQRSELSPVSNNYARR